MNISELKKDIQNKAAKCVKCGLCLPSCPTYNLTQNECESPRGRIALLDGLASDHLPLTEKLQTYLDHCLHCRACEAVCPAKVEYGKLIDQGQMLISKKNDKHRLPKVVDLVLRYPFLLKLAASMLRCYQQFGWQKHASKIRLLNFFGLDRINSLLPEINKQKIWQDYYPAKTTEQGRVILFAGCATNAFDQITLESAIKLLTAIGYGVYIPKKQKCCGALHKHAGQTETAKKLAADNQTIFQQSDITAIISVASGCGVVLEEYLDKIIDINAFLMRVVWPEKIVLKPLAKKVLLHTPCTLQNVLQISDLPKKLLEKIPAIELHTVQSQQCCGAAGLNMLQNQNMVTKLLLPIFQAFSAVQPDYFVSSNIGCALHINRELAEKGYKTRVIHPITLLAQQLIF